MSSFSRARLWPRVLVLALVVAVFAATAHASVGDRLPEFKDCLRVCRTENCADGKAQTPIPLVRRLLFWSCDSECDYACQHIVTNQRVDTGLKVVQFHGKWPFYRLLGMQEPLSVLWSLGNLWAHWDGLRKIQANIPKGYTLRPFYIWLSGIGIASWVFSAIFHTRDFASTEELDYFAAGANVLYGTYYTCVRIFRLDKRTPRRQSVLRAWTWLCISLYVCHVLYLKCVRWDYTYNMAANVAVGIVQNILWTWFSFTRYRKSNRLWDMVPGFVVAWVLCAMSMELFDFPPWFGSVDAHSMWHLMTIAPTVLMYNFLVRDSKDMIEESQRLKK